MTDPEAPEGGVIHRRAAKVIVVDRSGHVLLFRGRDPEGPADCTWWFPPGGGIEADETEDRAALRELRDDFGGDRDEKDHPDDVGVS